MKMGRSVVANVHTKARKRVLPMATFFNFAKNGSGIFGAEYRKVTNETNNRASQCCRMGKKQMAVPVSPIKYRARCQLLLFCAH